MFASILTAIFLLLLAAPQQPPADIALLDAAQTNDLAGVRRALDQGANVNAKTRYNSTALIVGATNGNLEMVRLLVERGADLKVQDSFYNFHAVSAAMSGGHIEVVTLLIEKGAPGAAEALTLAIQRRNLPLLAAVLSRSEISDKVVAATRALALKSGNTEMANLVQGAMASRSIPPNTIVSLSPAALQAFTGTYRSQATGQNIVVALKDDQLTATIGPPVMIFPTSDSSFVAPERVGAEVTFERKGDTVERAIVKVGPTT